MKKRKGTVRRPPTKNNILTFFVPNKAGKIIKKIYPIRKV